MKISNGSWRPHRRRRPIDRSRPSRKWVGYYHDEYYAEFHDEPFDYMVHAYSEKPLRYQYPTLSPIIRETDKLFEPIGYNRYLDLGLRGSHDFVVACGVRNFRACKFDPFFTLQGVWEQETGILALHLGMLNHSYVMHEEYTARTMHYYLKYHGPLFLVDSDKRVFYIHNYYHQYYYPFNHVVYCYAEEVPECLIHTRWEEKGYAAQYEPEVWPEREKIKQSYAASLGLDVMAVLGRITKAS